MATIKLKNSGTAGAVPTAGQLTTGEVAVNRADGAIFLKDTTGAVVQVARKLATSGVTITGTDTTQPVHSAGVAAKVQDTLDNFIITKTSGFWADDPTPGRHSRIDGRILSGTPYTGRRTAPLGGSWLSEEVANYFEKNAQHVFLAETRYGAIFASRAVAGGSVEGMALAALVQTKDDKFGRAIYVEVFHGSSSFGVGIEVQVGNYTGVTPNFNPYSVAGMNSAAFYASVEGSNGYVLGDASTPATMANAAAGAVMDVAGGSNGLAHHKFTGGVMFRDSALVRDGSGRANAHLMARGHQITWWANASAKGALIASDVTAASGYVDLVFGNNSIVLGGVSSRAIVKAQDDTAGAGAVNWVSIKNSRTGLPVEIKAEGSDTDVAAQIVTTGLGVTRFLSHAGSGENLRIAPPSAAPTDYLTVAGSAGGGYATLGADGVSANVDVRLAPKGAGYVRFGTWTASGDAPVNGYILVRDDATGTVRRIATIA